jgi:cysteinyl-tRNA synthetase
MLKIYNSLARDKQAFVSIEPGRVAMYVCGMTVYDFCHLGHARVMVVFDMVRAGCGQRLPAHLRAQHHRHRRQDHPPRQENGETIRQLTDRFIAAMNEDAGALGVLRPDAEPRATEFVPQMLDMIGTLEKNGYAYVAGKQ